MESGSVPGGRWFKSIRPDQFFHALTGDFWFFVYSTVDDFLDGRSLQVQQAHQPQADRTEDLLNRLFQTSSSLQLPNLTDLEAPYNPAKTVRSGAIIPDSNRSNRAAPLDYHVALLE